MDSSNSGLNFGDGYDEDAFELAARASDTEKSRAASPDTVGSGASFDKKIELERERLIKANSDVLILRVKETSNEFKNLEEEAKNSDSFDDFSPAVAVQPG